MEKWPGLYPQSSGIAELKILFPFGRIKQKKVGRALKLIADFLTLKKKFLDIHINHLPCCFYHTVNNNGELLFCR